MNNHMITHNLEGTFSQIYHQVQQKLSEWYGHIVALIRNHPNVAIGSLMLTIATVAIVAKRSIYQAQQKAKIKIDQARIEKLTPIFNMLKENKATNKTVLQSIPAEKNYAANVFKIFNHCLEPSRQKNLSSQQKSLVKEILEGVTIINNQISLINESTENLKKANEFIHKVLFIKSNSFFNKNVINTEIQDKDIMDVSGPQGLLLSTAATKKCTEAHLEIKQAHSKINNVIFELKKIQRNYSNLLKITDIALLGFSALVIVMCVSKYLTSLEDISGVKFQFMKSLMSIKGFPLK